jgi:sulfofructose kinase
VTVSVPDFPPEDSKAEATSLRESGGGPAANAAYLLGKWGVPTAFAGVIGDDPQGEQIRREFREVGVDLSASPVPEGRATPVSIILVSERTGSRTIVTRKSPGAPLVLSPLDAKPQVLLFDGHELPASLAAIERYPEARTILDAGSLREGTAELAKRVDYLIASERFARQVTGLQTLEESKDRARAVAELANRNGRRVVITLGARGLIHGTGSEFEHLPTFPVRAIDTTGAGDIFHGAFAYGLLMGWEFSRNLRFASMTAAISVQEPGGRASIPLRKTVEDALSQGI